MPSCLSDILQVIMLAAGPDTFLRRRGANVIPFLSSQEDILKLIHTCIGKKQCWVIGRNKRRAFDDTMPALLEVLQKELSDLVSSQVNFLTVLIRTDF